MTVVPDDVERVVLGGTEVAGRAVADEVEVDAGWLAEAVEEGIEEVLARADEDAGAVLPGGAACPETADLPHAVISAATRTVAAPAVGLFMIRTSAEYPAQPGRARRPTPRADRGDVLAAGHRACEA